MAYKDIPVQCTRCKYKHMKSERVGVPDRKIPGMENLVCPRCGARPFFDLSPMVAWCLASGLIETGETVPDGAIKFAHGPKANLKVVIEAVARHGYGASAGRLLVPGIPEAENQKSAADALQHFVDWAGAGRFAKKHGVTFSFEEA